MREDYVQRVGFPSSAALEVVSGKVLAAATANLGASSRGPSPAVTQPLGGPGSSDEPQVLNMPRRDFRGSCTCCLLLVYFLYISSYVKLLVFDGLNERSPCKKLDTRL